MIPVDWQPNLPEAALAPAAVHLYLLTLSDFEHYQEQFESILTPEELDSMSRARPRVRLERAVSRGALRFVLSRYTRESAAAIRLEASPQGKPRIADSSVEFNLSHSNGLVLIGVTCNIPIGVDIEAMRAGLSSQSLADRFFGRSEARTIAGLPERARDFAFVRCWTRKEAVIKAFGRGVWDMLPLFEVDMGDQPRLVRLDVHGYDLKQVTLQDILVPEGFWAAVAVLGKVDDVTRCRLTPQNLGLGTPTRLTNAPRADDEDA